MITNLRIQNVALIDEVEVSFASGLNVLTGETGAGKSIVVDSINFLLGGRSMRDFIRTGADFAHVEGVLEVYDDVVIEGLSSLGITVDEGQLMLSRTMQAASGKSTCRINGRAASVGLLKDAAAMLVDLHGQHEHQSLLEPDKQLRLLDGFCGKELSDQKLLLEGLLAQYREASRALKVLSGTGNQREEQISLWQQQLNEIEKAELKPMEEEVLGERRTRLGGLEKLGRSTAEVLSLLFGDGASDGEAEQLSAAEQTARASSILSEIAKLDPPKAELSARLEDVFMQLTDISRDLRLYMDELEADPRELELIEARLDVIYRLKKKFGATVDDVLKKRDEIKAKLDGIADSEVEIKRLQAVRRGLGAEITELCDKMNAVRMVAAAKVSSGASEILWDLGMQNARFLVEISRKTAFGSDGNDIVEFMISPNPGEALKPLRRIASGGEMSRVMLAIKTVMADADRVSTVIFDEVDAGVSGRTAQQVAEKLMAVSRRRQILCITHLPQIAAMADTHFLIEKLVHESEEQTRTVTSVKSLPQESMINELARLIGGAKITPATLEAAREMKVQADVLKG